LWQYPRPGRREYGFEGKTTPMGFISELIEMIAIVWLVRFVLNTLLGSGNRGPISAKFRARPAENAEPVSEPTVISGEMKKDPQCGTYVSTELSLKSRHEGETVHFCSPQCQEEFLQAHSRKHA